ncbi:MAG: hypothetical protein HZB14_07380 [Actinobacteria bacterium]|nr:hypothetical protein [Actinomycetota bacterium]
MAEAPDNLVFATGFVPAGADAVWPLVSDVTRWVEVFPEWLTEVHDDDEPRTRAASTSKSSMNSAAPT